MARYGVIADIHGNREALAAAFEALQALGAAPLACLGDIIGYNADPDECVALVRSRCNVSIAGNHELIGLRRLGFRRCSNDAEYALRRTRRTLSSHSARWLAALPERCLLEDGIALVHGGVRDVQQYMKTPAHIRANARLLREDFPQARLCFFGHSHEQKVYEVDGDRIRELPLEEEMFLHRDLVYFVNPGSVDASRKRTAKAAECAILDTGAWSVQFVRARYDCAAAEAKAAALGYRIGPFIDRLYTFRRRLARRLAFIPR